MLEGKATNSQRFAREFFGLFLIFWGLLVLLSLLTFDINDPSLNHVVSRPTIVRNSAGLFGAYLSGFLVDIFGVTSFIWPLVFGALGAAYVSTTFELHWWRWCGYFLITLCLLTAGSAWDLGLGDVRGGGVIGRTLFNNTSLFLSPGGGALLWFFVILVALQLSFGLSAITMSMKIYSFFMERLVPTTFTHPKIPRLALPKINLSGPMRAIAGTLSLSRKRFGKKDELPEIMIESKAAPQEDKDDGFDDLFVPHKKLIDVSPVQNSEPAKGSIATALSSLAQIGSAKKTQSEEPANNGEALASSTLSSGTDDVGAGDDDDTPVGAVKVKTSFLAKFKPKPASPPPATLPSLDLLAKAGPESSGSKSSPQAKERMAEKGRALMACLGEFGVQGELVHITPGPVVTMFEVRPAPGIRVSRIANLSDDLKRGLKAEAVRIQAPVPGTDTVGIEIPNDLRETVNFRELLASDDFKKADMILPMVIGRDISGKPQMADLMRMPHLLVAGTTGAGKSVCLNTILLSFLYKFQPSDLRMLLIDPKRIELAVYSDLPHLVHPVVTEMNLAKNALDWAVHEMESRYERMARLGVRNIGGYNQKLAAFGDKRPTNFDDLEPMPFMVIIIDELADLMLTAAREVETSIVRLAQLARAAGIHMILATQRPSVDVVTGLIKANFPCRISFQVPNKHDSRTILDAVGAEHLLGKGDMLFKPGGGKITRMHGPFVSDDDVFKVVEYWKRQLKPTYNIDFAEWGQDSGEAAGHGADGDTSQDPLYADVRDFVSGQGRASISLLQRRFKIGFNRAARLVEQLERDGIIGPADGSKPRTIIK